MHGNQSAILSVSSMTGESRYKVCLVNFLVGDWFRTTVEALANKCFGKDWARLTRDFLFDNDGRVDACG